MSMTGPIGYFVHHQGRGHAERAAAIANELIASRGVTLFCARDDIFPALDERTAGLAWRLRPADGLPVVISVRARGADRIPEALAVLPGFSVMRASKAFEHDGLGVRPIWRRSVHGRGFL